MAKDNNYITMLGTGNALATRCYNHTDHLLGCVWMMRMALQFHHSLHVWSHLKVLRLLTDICQQILPKKEAEGIGSIVVMHELEFTGQVWVPDDLEKIPLDC